MSNPFAPPTKPMKPARGGPPPNPFATAAAVVTAAHRFKAGLEAASPAEGSESPTNPFGPPPPPTPLGPQGPTRQPSLGNPFAPAAADPHPLALVKPSHPTSPFAPTAVPLPSVPSVPSHSPPVTPGNPFAPSPAPPAPVPVLTVHRDSYPPDPAPIPPVHVPVPEVRARGVSDGFPSSVPPVPPPLPPLPSVPVPQSPVSQPPVRPVSQHVHFLPTPPVPVPAPVPVLPVSVSGGMGGFDEFGDGTEDDEGVDPFAPTAAGVVGAFGAPAPAARAGHDDFFATPVPAAAPTGPIGHDAFFTSMPVLPAAPPVPAPVPVPVEPEVIGLPPLPPQAADDDDPYDMHVLPPTPPAPVAAPPVPVTRSTPSAPVLAAVPGDPFAVFAPLKPSVPVPVTAAPVSVRASQPLSALLQETRASPAAPVMVAHGPPLNAPFNPFAPKPSPVPVSQPAVQPVLAAHAPVPAAAAASPWPAPSVPSAAPVPVDPFGFGSAPLVPTHPTPSIHTHIQSHGFDDFIPSVPAPAAPAAAVDDLAFLEAFASMPKPSHHPPVPAHVPAPVPAHGGFEDLEDTFGDCPDPFAPAPAPAPVRAAGRAPSITLPPPPAPVSAAAFKHKPTAPVPAAVPAAVPAHGHDDGLMDAFGFDFSPSKPSAAVPVDPFDSDPFGDASPTGDAADAMASLRRAYSLPEGSDESDEDHRSVHPIPKVIMDGRQQQQQQQQHEAMSKQTGDVLTRLSTKSLMTKDWHDHYYVIDKGVLMLFKTKMDYDYNPSGTNCKKKIPITHTMRVLQIKSKDYKGFGTLYNFMVEEIMDYGTVSVGKFASAYQQVVQALWKKLRQVILYRREQRARQLKGV